MLVLGALLFGACTSPTPIPSPSPSAAASEEQVAAEPGREELIAALRDIAIALETAHADLDGAAASSGEVAERAAAEFAVHILVADPRFAGDLDGDGSVATPPTAPLLPGAADAGSATALNLLYPAIAAARSTAGAEGGVVAVLTEAVVGDVTSWQRNPVAPIQAVELAVDDGTEEAINALEGGAVRALAWSLHALEADDPTTVHEGVERAAANIALARTAVANLLNEI